MAPDPRLCDRARRALTAELKSAGRQSVLNEATSKTSLQLGAAGEFFCTVFDGRHRRIGVPTGSAYLVRVGLAQHGAAINLPGVRSFLCKQHRGKVLVADTATDAQLRNVLRLAVRAAFPKGAAVRGQKRVQPQVRHWKWGIVHQEYVAPPPRRATSAKRR